MRKTRRRGVLILLAELKNGGRRNNMLEHLSHSSICLFNHNRHAWHRRYILEIKEQMTNPSALTGVGLHKYLEGIYKGVPDDVAREVAVAFIKSVTEIEWGETGSIEKCLDELDKLIGYCKEGLPVFHKILGAEMAVQEKIKGIKIPFMAFIDLVYEDERGDINLADWKTTKKLEDKIKPAFIVQAIIYAMLLEAHFKRKPKSMTFFQMKASVNKDGSPQIKPLVLIFAEHPELFRAVKGLIKMTIKEMMRKKQYTLPNVRDTYESETSWKSFVEQYA